MMTLSHPVDLAEWVAYVFDHEVSDPAWHFDRLRQAGTNRLHSVTTIYLVRHAHADWRNDDNRSLSPAGFEAARALGERLAAFPIAAIYSSPHRRAIETITPLADRLGLRPQLMDDLRERELPPVGPDELEQIVEETWRTPDAAVRGGESNCTAQRRGLAVVRELVDRHGGEHIVAATHGTLLALILNGLDATYGYDFWKQLQFPDTYCLTFESSALENVQRI